MSRPARKLFRKTPLNPNVRIMKHLLFCANSSEGNIAGIPRLGFPGICLQDGPLAIRLADYASVFPAGLTVAASWDRDLAHRRGQEMGMEFKGKGANVILGPVAGPLGRSAYGGRNWEGFSPDPYLTGVMFQEVR